MSTNIRLNSQYALRRCTMSYNLILGRLDDGEYIWFAKYRVGLISPSAVLFILNNERPNLGNLVPFVAEVDKETKTASSLQQLIFDEELDRYTLGPIRPDETLTLAK